MLVKLRNTNPQGEVDLPLIGRVLAAGEEFDIDSDLAGTAPSDWRPVAEDETPDRCLTREAADGTWETYNPGSGLLAQVGNYELVVPEVVTKATKAAASAE